MVQWLRLHAPNAGAPGSIPAQGTRSHMHAATKSSHAATKRSCMPQLKILCAATKTQRSERKKERERERKKERKKEERKKENGARTAWLMM